MESLGPFLFGASPAHSLRAWEVFLVGASDQGTLEARYASESASRLTVMLEPISFHARGSRARAHLQPGVQAVLAVNDMASQEALEAFEALQPLLLRGTVELVRLPEPHGGSGRSRGHCDGNLAPSLGRRKR